MSDVQSLAPGALVELFTLDATPKGGSLLRWSNDVNALGNDIVFSGNSYSRFPVEANGFEKTGTGSLPRPTLRVANVSGLVSAMIAQLDGLVGCKVTRTRIFSKYLDAVNFPGGVNPLADPNAAFTPEVWYIDRKASENGIFVEFELAAAFDVSGVLLPRRQCIQNVCTWQYRSAECGYTGTQYFDRLDKPATLANDACGKRLQSCELRFGVNAELPFGGFPAVGLIR